MASFYGGASIYRGGDGGGSSDYNDLSNQPIKNLTGKVILDALGYGDYLLTGSYLYDKNDTELKEISPKVLITVTKDQFNQEKIITFDYISDGDAYSKIIIYHSDGSYSVSDHSHVTNSSNLLYIDEEEPSLPI